MAKVLELSTHRDPRGTLTVIEKVLPFDVQRVYYIYGCNDQPRGGHRHHVTTQALVCVHGSCVVDWHDGTKPDAVVLDRPDRLLVVEPQDWHVMRDFTSDAVLLGLASHPFDADDYIYEAYER